MKRALPHIVAALLVVWTGPAAAKSPSTTSKAPKWDVNAPPGPKKRVPIDTRTGTWMNVDVHPDGTKVVFDLLGDIYELPITGGTAKALTQGMAWDMQPKYSPDGRSIAFTSDRNGGDNLWVMKADGSDARALTTERFRLLTSPAWTPDGRYVAGRKHFTSKRSIGAGEIWLYAADRGGAGLPLTTKLTEQKDLGEPAFSADGRWLYTSRDASPGKTFQYNKDPNGQIYIIERLDRTTGRIEKVVGGAGGAVRPTPSPDGKALVYVRRARGKSLLVWHDLTSGAERVLTDILDRDLQETWAIHGVYPAMGWTRDSKTLVFWAQGGLHRVNVAKATVTPIPFRVVTEREVVEAIRFPVKVAPDRFDVKMLRWVTVCPFDKHVVFEALGQLWVRKLPAGKPRRLTRDTGVVELMPTISRDGRTVAYATWRDDGFGDIRVVPIKGGASRQVVRQPGHYVEPTFSPDGRHLVYRKTRGGWLRSAMWSNDPGLYRVAVTGKTPPIRIARQGRQPHFGADPNTVYYTTAHPKRGALLMALALSGTERQPREVGSGKAIRRFRVSPNGQWVTFVEDWNAWVTALPATGRSITFSRKSKAMPVGRASKDVGDWVHWSGDSQRLHWNLGPELFTQTLGDDFLEPGEGEDKKEPAPSQTLGFSFAHDAPRGGMALVGARLVTMEGDQVIEDGTLVMKGNRIEAVGPRATTAVPRGYKVVDGTGLTAIPGLIDVHDHGSQSEYGITPERSWKHDAMLAFGVTTIHDPSNHSQSIFAARELIQAGAMFGPRTFSTGTILYGAEGAFRSRVNSLEDARQHLTRMKAMERSR